MMKAQAGSVRESAALLGEAVHRNRPWSIDGVLERMFTFAFRDLVYPQIWEDPRVDMAALEITPTTRLVTIASGGCNALSYLTADPERVFAVDLNCALIALNKLKIEAVRHIPDHGRDRLGRRRIERFTRNFYRYGLLGRFIALAHGIARLYGRSPRRMMQARTRREQVEIFDTELAPLFDRRLVRWLLGHRAALYGLGIPPAQYAALIGDAEHMADVVRNRLRKLACDFDLSDTYFAWQAFQRSYPRNGAGPLPPYLDRGAFEAIKARVDRLSIELESMTRFLSRQAAASLDGYVLLDAQDWMSDGDITELWNEITRTARPGARVIFRTAGEPTILPGRVPAEVLACWHYQEARSKELTSLDRSAIYGGFHLYTRAS
jgi:S-adenosylmethionine-diacylglycerol 3-amino-3-carboxypropyl transferase